MAVDFTLRGEDETSAQSVMYELDMLEHAYKQLLSAPSDEEGRLARNAHLESFLIHARALHDFFRPSTRTNDIRASDWLPGHRISPPLAPDVVSWINKHVAHLTRERARKGEWQIQSIRQKVRLAFDDFVSQLTSEQREEFARWVPSNETKNDDYHHQTSTTE